MRSPNAGKGLVSVGSTGARGVAHPGGFSTRQLVVSRFRSSLLPLPDIQGLPCHPTQLPLLRWRLAERREGRGFEDHGRPARAAEGRLGLPSLGGRVGGGRGQEPYG